MTTSSSLAAYVSGPFTSDISYIHHLYLNVMLVYNTGMRSVGYFYIRQILYMLLLHPGIPLDPAVRKQKEGTTSSSSLSTDDLATCSWDLFAWPFLHTLQIKFLLVLSLRLIPEQRIITKDGIAASYKMTHSTNILVFFLTVLSKLLDKTLDFSVLTPRPMNLRLIYITLL